MVVDGIVKTKMNYGGLQLCNNIVWERKRNMSIKIFIQLLK